ncbi:MAG: energy-dependent translational throttle protein EttA [Planctomycetota bacterium]|nr:MAG: energy-dependent translational throttle protein EttA [Planctomycetota bacterium]
MASISKGEQVIQAVHLNKQFGDVEILKDLNFSFDHGDRIGFLGVNGAGKSTLMKILAGEDKAFEGQLIVRNEMSRGYVPQEPTLDDSKTVKENVELGVVHIRQILERYNQINIKLGEDITPEEMEKLLEELDQLQGEIDSKNAWEIDFQLEIAMDALSLPGPDESVKTLSGGERRRVALCRSLMEHPDLIILDEPTNHLDSETVLWLEHYLANYSGTCILVTHDRYFLDNVVNKMMELERGQLQMYKGNYSSYLEAKSSQVVILKKQENTRQKWLKKELEWIRSGTKARETKSKARIANYEKMVEEGPLLFKADAAAFQIPDGPRLGSKVIRIENLKKGYDGRILIKDFNFEVQPGAIIGVIGVNGIGKSTLIKMIMGKEPVDEGNIDVGKNTVFGYIDQGRDTLDPEKTVYEEISEGEELVIVNKREMPMRNYVTKFLFSGAIQQTKVGLISGGERNRVHLAKMLKHSGNFLILDEPTNDLDLATLQVLEEAIDVFLGCAFIISHDRFFLNKICTGILAFEGDTKIHYHQGNFEEYHEDYVRRMKEKAESEGYEFDENMPQKSKYKKLKKV